MGILPNCKDPALTLLKEQGYNVVQLPRVDLLPTHLLVNRNGKLQRIGDLLSVFVLDPGGPPPPPISDDRPGPTISGKTSADIDASIGLSILGGLISALGGSKLGINFAYAKASTVQFEYSSTLEANSQLALIDQFLAGSRVNPLARAVTEMLNDDKIYVVTSVLKSNKISVSAKDASKQSIGLDLPVVQEAIGFNVKVAGAQGRAGLVTFEGAVPLAFGFQAVQLIFDKGIYRSMKLVETGKVVAEGTENDPVRLEVDEFLLTED